MTEIEINFYEKFAQAVEDGTKRQTMRKAKCTKVKAFKGEHCIVPGYTEPECYDEMSCYTYKIKAGDTLKLYTGLGQRKYCKRWPDRLSPHCESTAAIDMKTGKCETSKVCQSGGAKPLRKATCTESFPVKFEDLTDGVALMDGFRDKEVIKTTTGAVRLLNYRFWVLIDVIFGRFIKIPLVEKKKILNDGINELITALDQLKNFLIENYDAKDGDVFQITRW